MKKKVIVIGGGITGLTATYYLQKQQESIDCELIEASERLGGKIETVCRDGFVIERGPDSFLERKISATRLAKEVGLEDKLVNNSAGKSFVLARGRLHPMPDGAVMGIPTQIAPFVTTNLFSFKGKMRAALDFVMPPMDVEGDISLGYFFRERLGEEVVENLIEPLLSGIYAGNIDKLSLQATFPQYFDLEQKHGSLVLGMKKMMPPPSKIPIPKKGMFQTLTTGLQSLVDAIEEKLIPNTVLKGVGVEEITKKENQYVLTLSNGEERIADAIIVSAPHQVVPTMFPTYDFFAPFTKMPSTSVATVALAFDGDIEMTELDGTGFVISRNEEYTITACTWTDKKWVHSTPTGKRLLRCFVGRESDDSIVDCSDEEILEIVLSDLERIMGLTAKPEFSVITRMKKSMPQYMVGHKTRMEMIEKNMAEQLPGVFLAGTSYHGFGIPDCINQGEAAVTHVVNYLK